MNKIVLSRKNLEALSSADLISLADEFDIDIPEDLNRRFIIAELLDIARETQEDSLSGLIITHEKPVEAGLPATYNETVLSAVRSNPVWLYVYWDISVQDWAIINANKVRAALILRVAVLGGDGQVVQKESFDVPVVLTDTDQFILLPSGECTAGKYGVRKYIRVELILETPAEKPRLLSVSGSVPLTRSCPDFRESLLNDDPPMLELSGFKELMRTHFLQHRQSFS
jgi:hypothetical protein